MERVVITGMGAVSALGLGAENNFLQALGGHSGISLLEPTLSSYLSCDVAAAIRFTLPDLLKKKRSTFI